MPVTHIVYRLSFVHGEFASGYKKHEILRSGFEKNLVQPLLRFADVLAVYTGAIDHSLVQEGIDFAAFLVD